jgi:hypothetical protein
VADKYLLENGTDAYLLEDGSGVYLLEDNWYFRQSEPQAKFKPHNLFALPLYRQNPDNATPVPPPQPGASSQAVVITYELQRAPIAANRYFQNQANDLPSTVVAETNTHFIAKYRSPQYVVSISLRTNIAADFSTAQVQPETQPHFIATYQPHLFRLFGYFSAADQIGAGAAETNTHYLARYQPQNLKVSIALRTNIAADFSTAQTQPETNTSFLGRFRPPSLLTLPLLRQNTADSPAAAVVADPGPHFIAKHKPAAFNRFSYNFNGSDFSTAQPQVEAASHFIARFQEELFTISTGTFQSGANDASAVLDQNTHFIGKFSPYQLARFRYNYSGSDFSSFLTQPATNTHFTARFQPTNYKVSITLRQNQAADAPSAAVTETNAHWIARFTPHSLAVPLRLRTNIAADFSTPQVQPETQPHFAATFTPHLFRLFGYFSAADQVAGATVETNTHFIAKYQQGQYLVSVALRQNTANDTSTFSTQPETNTHFVPRFVPARHAVAALLRQNAATDVPAFVLSETNTNFLAKFAPHKINVNRNNYNGSDFSAPAVQPETNVTFNFLGVHKPLPHSLLFSLRTNPNTDFVIGPPPAPPVSVNDGGKQRHHYRLTKEAALAIKRAKEALRAAELAEEKAIADRKEALLAIVARKGASEKKKRARKELAEIERTTPHPLARQAQTALDELVSRHKSERVQTARRDLSDAISDYEMVRTEVRAREQANVDAEDMALILLLTT